MSGKLQQEIHQGKPFPSPEAEFALNILRTADGLIHAIERTLKPHGLTSTQYNVLRILRGAGMAGATCTAIAERLINRQPDVTRLVDRMEKAGLLTRARASSDRRVTTITITERGRQLLAGLDAPLLQLQARQFAGLDAQQVRDGIAALETIRETLAQAPE